MNTRPGSETCNKTKMFPVRCYTCGCVLAHLHPTYREGVQTETSGKVLDHLDVRRICCRRMFLGHVDIVRDQLAYANVDMVLDEARSTVLRRAIKKEHEVGCE